MIYLLFSTLGLHQREVFLFNDILVITKIHSRKKNTVTYTFRQSYLLAGLSVTTFETQHYPYGIRVTQKWDRKTVLTLNARNEHDRTKVGILKDLKLLFFTIFSLVLSAETYLAIAYFYLVC